jgi:hypothetical protein
MELSDREQMLLAFANLAGRSAGDAQRGGRTGRRVGRAAFRRPRLVRTAQHAHDHLIHGPPPIARRTHPDAGRVLPPALTTAALPRSDAPPPPPDGPRNQAPAHDPGVRRAGRRTVSTRDPGLGPAPARQTVGGDGVDMPADRPAQRRAPLADGSGGRPERRTAPFAACMRQAVRDGSSWRRLSEPAQGP